MMEKATKESEAESYRAAELFVEWLERQITLASRGDNETALDVEPSGKYWLGRLASEDFVANTGLGERGERLEPCAQGIRVRPFDRGPWTFRAHVSAVCWILAKDKVWRKSERIDEHFSVTVEEESSARSFGAEALEKALTRAAGTSGLSAEVRTELEPCADGGSELTVTLVNTSADTHKVLKDTRLYECRLEIRGLKTRPFILEALPDSFRYDRRIDAYGVNCGVSSGDKGSLFTVDTVTASKVRPRFWGSSEPEPDLSFRSLERDPISAARGLRDSLAHWGAALWNQRALEKKAEQHQWSPEMLNEAKAAAQDFNEELDRIAYGVELLEKHDELRRSFQLMNRAMAISSRGKYDNWRPFQIGFLLANLRCIAEPESESDIVDIVWFATGGGKTETYLGLVVTASLFDRLRGKTTGITAWSRFPLRMLSLQQMQRFADAVASAETVRREANIPGAPFSLGFFVGQGATPNSVKEDAPPGDPWDPDDERMPDRLRVLQKCPFCNRETIKMSFNRVLWKLEHQCVGEGCPWPERALPFYVVDEEIYRFLPTVLVGTLDKAASIGMQASMRGFVGAPWGQCSRDGHGFVYAPRAKRPTGCLVPGCNSPIRDLSIAKHLFGLTFRLQDELHLLRDSLGAVDAHYEALYDGLQQDLCGFRPKILASSATLTGYERQADVLYRRKARVFPQQGPSAVEGFWTASSDSLMRSYVALAPRGVTIEYAVDRLLTELQRNVRKLSTEPEAVCREIGIETRYASKLLSWYGTDVVYGNTLRDLDAVVRSMETQVQVAGRLNADSLTGRTEFETVREILRRLEKPEEDFQDRLHLISASSMMSHGVDIDRLNVMVMLGIPLTTAEFIQATARIGRRLPGLVFVVHKIGRERDASVFRSFPKFVEQGDRFVEPVPVTRRSRRVLERTVAGLEMARILMIHEPNSKGSLATLRALKRYLVSSGFTFAGELKALFAYLGLRPDVDTNICADLESWMSTFERNVNDPLPGMQFPGDASPSGKPMRSLRDVEEQVPLFLNRMP